MQALTCVVGEMTPRRRARTRLRAGRDDDATLRLRSEAEAPFRVVRLTLYGSAVIGGGVGLMVNLVQIIGAVAQRPGAPTLTEAVKNVGIDAAAVLVFGALSWSEWKARGQQMRRLARESRLAELGVETATGKMLRLMDLRGFARVVRLGG